MGRTAFRARARIEGGCSQTAAQPQLGAVESAFVVNTAGDHIYVLSRPNLRALDPGRAFVVSAEVKCAATGELVVEVTPRTQSAMLNGFLHDIALSPDGKTACVAGASSASFLCLDTATLATGPVLPSDYSEPTTNVVFGPTGVLYGAGRSRTLRGYDVQTGKSREYQILAGVPVPGQLVISADGRTLIALEEGPRLEFVRVTP